METESELLPLLETLYDSRNPTRRWLHRTRRDWIFGKLRQYARGDRALEVGFGAGVYLSALAELFSEVVGTDLEEAHLRHARKIALKYPNLRLLRDDICNSRLAEGSFSLVLCSEVIEHLPDSPAALAAIYRLLEPGGVLILSTPQRRSLLELSCKVAFLPGVINLVRKVYGEAIFETEHINLLTSAQAARQLEAAGFTIRERFKSGMYLPAVAEFGGASALRLQQWLEGKLEGRRPDWMLWTQYYVAARE
ncbi:MAG TPA: methyltransferase domain-containing protein [Candidatus Binataceae bacterium]|jgi:2-polyprenyl-3-methyl-5-hydroxy-6-metoxy-1,4-benzoquinol methylase|nr:methyltransferase domain-containing protein [Candidatus Binataceae bacterium]